MTPSRLLHLLDRATAVEWLAATAAAASVAAVLVLTVGLSAARSTPVGSAEGARRVAALTHGDLREAALAALEAEMEPGAAATARRFDPAAFEAAAPPFGFVADDPALAELRQAQQAQDEAAQRLNQAIPFAQEVAAAPPFVLRARTGTERERAVRCLTNAIYYEAALEPADGQRAVAQVVLNRVRDPNFPKSICGVVYQGWDRVTGCQFSFTCDGALVRTPIAAIWRENRKIAEAALNGFVMPAVGLATHYHADYVAPYWAPNLVKVSQIGAHIFYRWPGGAGRPQAFTGAYAGGETRISEAVLTGRAARAQASAGAGPPGTATGLGRELPGGVRTVAVVGPDGRAMTRVQGSFTPAGGLPYGRRAPTPEEIARINASLDQRFPTAAAPAEPAPAKPAETATAAPAPTAAEPEPVPAG